MTDILRFFVTQNQINENKIVLSNEDSHHLKNVLRAKIGDKISVCDDKMTQYECGICNIEEKSIELNILNSSSVTGELPIEVILFQCVPKREKFEFIIQKAVELGIHEITPAFSKRTEVNKKNFNDKNDRYNKIALSAAKQCGRGYIPKILNAIDFNQALSEASLLDTSILCYENCKTQSLKDIFNGTKFTENKKIGIIVGPEGGFEESEVEMAIKSNIFVCSLGTRIMRTETVAIYLLSIINYLFS